MGIIINMNVFWEKTRMSFSYHINVFFGLFPHLWEIYKPFMVLKQKPFMFPIVKCHKKSIVVKLMYINGLITVTINVIKLTLMFFISRMEISI